MGLGFAYGTFIRHTQHEEKKISAGCCSHDLFESLSGVEFPKSLMLAAATASNIKHLTGCHKSPIPFSVIGALAGFSFGAWTGRCAVDLTNQYILNKKAVWENK